ncbi:MAG TPA: DUF4115 domain-containing protein [Rugosibacter sp.]|nr:DUF4115 domain-containing protein [Rugosibacter sp.]HQN47314.1 DUF4115 domain-containing protein [Rugosibacter sp.]HQQ34834.1 DUF4115 domain-containing protein [Rugosibacter sp.]
MSDSSAVTPAAECGLGECIAAQAPGMVLREARERLFLSIDAVAAATRFSPRQVDALERGDLNSLPGLTTIRGLVRAYAKHVNIDAMPLLADLNALIPTSPLEVRPPGNLGLAQPAANQTRRFLLLLCFLAVAVLLGLTGYGLLKKPIPLVAQQTSIQAMPAGEVTERASEVAGGLSKAETSAALDAANAGNATGGSTLPEGGNSMLSVAGAAAGSDAIKSVDTLKQVAGAPASAQTPASVAALTPALSASPVLNFVFKGLSWVEVRDASNKVILSGEFPAGTKQTVTGRPPFKLWLGQASAVSVSYGLQPIDLQPHTRAGIARLTVQ